MPPDKTRHPHWLSGLNLLKWDGSITERVSNAAEESNAENLLVIHDRKLAERYINNWQEHAQHSEVYAGLKR